jgi:hypothetical protein
MDRAEALILLKQLSTSRIIDPSWFSVENKGEAVELKIREPQKSSQLEQFCSNNNLKLEEKNGYLLISKL